MLSHEDEQKLIGRALVHQSPPRMSFMDWWPCVDVELHALGCWSDSVWGEAYWRYHQNRSMTPRECAAAILAEREATKAASGKAAP
jgi:hypothetical protein